MHRLTATTDAVKSRVFVPWVPRKRRYQNCSKFTFAFRQASTFKAQSIYIRFTAEQRRMRHEDGHECCVGKGLQGGCRTERIALMLPTRAGTRLKPRHEETFVVFLSPSKQTMWCYVKSGHDRFLPEPPQVIIHWQSYRFTLYNKTF
jgi:hypothetical protein